MTDHEQMSDEALLAALRSDVRQLDPVPAEAALAARSAIAYRDLDAQLAVLVSDSLDDEAGLAAVRSGRRSRHIMFRAESASFEVELELLGDHVVLSGQVVPPTPAAVAVEHRGGALSADVSEHGDFAVPACPRGPLRIRLTGADGRVVTSAWIVA